MRGDSRGAKVIRQVRAPSKQRGMFPAIAWLPPLVQTMSGTKATSAKTVSQVRNNEAGSRGEWPIAYVQFLLMLNLAYISLESLQYKNNY
jgi:hypothetical protein